MSWKRHATRSYIRETANTQAFVFGASRPMQMWAWVVLWRKGKASGVELSFLGAQREADNTILEVEHRIPNAPKPQFGATTDENLTKENTT